MVSSASAHRARLASLFHQHAVRRLAPRDRAAGISVSPPGRITFTMDAFPAVDAVGANCAKVWLGVRERRCQ